MAETSTIFGFMKYVSATDILSDFKKTVDSHFVNSLNRESLLCTRHGWGTWIRTKEMSDSESDALPLGYTPMCLFIIHYWLFFYKCFFM